MTDRGHTLVEVLVAFTLTVLLAAGLLRFLGAGLSAVDRLGSALAAQRSLRRAVEELSDDVLEAGFRVPCRREGPPGGSLSIRRGRTRAADELTLVKDVVLPGQGRLAGPVRAGPAAAPVAVVASHGTRLEPGDLLVVEGGAWEGLRVASEVALAEGRTGEVPLAAPALSDHAEGAPVAFVRPSVPVRYALGPLGRGEPGSSLVRWEGQGAGRVVAPHLTGFQAELLEEAGRPPRVRLTLQAQAGAGPRRSLTLVLRPRQPRP